MLFLLSKPKPKKAKIDRRKLCFKNERRLKLCLKTAFTIFLFQDRSMKVFLPLFTPDVSSRAFQKIYPAESAECFLNLYYCEPLITRRRRASAADDATILSYQSCQNRNLLFALFMNRTQNEDYNLGSICPGPPHSGVQQVTFRKSHFSLH